MLRVKNKSADDTFIMYVVVKSLFMDLIKEYKTYVEWCKGSSVNNIGFVSWKEKKFNATFNRKTGVWSKNT